MTNIVGIAVAAGSVAAAGAVAGRRDAVMWPGAGEHRELLVWAERVIEELSSLRARLEPAEDVEHYQHSQFADRARGLADQLTAAITLVRLDLYGPALGCLRIAMEQTAVDHLMFLGRRLIQVAEDVDESTWAEWNRQRAAGENFRDVVEWSRTRRGTVEMISEGMWSKPSEQGERYVLSPYYFLLEDFQPYLGSPAAQAMFDDGIGDPERDRDWAKRNDLYYRTYLSWSSVKRNLKLNGFADETTAAWLDVHYRFLSAFVHPLSHVDHLLYGRHARIVPAYDHYTSELALLYSVAFGVTELRNFLRMLGEPPAISLTDHAGTTQFGDQAWDAISYLWFPGHRPHRFDRVNEANRRAFRARRESSQPVEIDDPDGIPDEAVRYYRDPLARLVKLHGDSVEMLTGLSFQSPWPRGDARFR